MPYIPQADRTELLTKRDPRSLGELDFVITKIVLEFMEKQNLTRFDQLAGIIGTLDLIKDECRRRIVHPYEDQKRWANGDVFPAAPRCPKCFGPKPPCTETKCFIHGVKIE